MQEEEVFTDPELMTSFCDLMLKEDTDSYEAEACKFNIREKRGMGVPAPPSPKVTLIPTVAPMPFLRHGPADAFMKLKQACIDNAGIDFLAVCGDVMRSKDFSSNKPGVAQKSFHKTGSAFDYDQASRYLIVVSEPIEGKQYFRTYLKCSKQDGTMGTKRVLKDIRGYKTHTYCWDFTRAAEILGWRRIPAWTGWQNSYTKKEFWHYQITENQTYEYWINFLYGGTETNVFRALKFGDSGQDVKTLQDKLITLGFLKGKSDGQFGPKTLAAVVAVQKANKLSQDGMVGLRTMTTIDNLLKQEKTKMSEFDYNTADVNTQVATEADENATPKPFYATSQFLTLIATYILGPVAMYLASKGLIAPEQAPALIGIFQTAIVAGMAYVTKQFMKNRGDIATVKAQAAAARSLASQPNAPEALAAFRSFGR
jgi:peptidoglycan hydrolase-like protein with peptidoglycan-binding domain